MKIVYNIIKKKNIDKYISTILDSNNLLVEGFGD